MHNFFILKILIGVSLTYINLKVVFNLGSITSLQARKWFFLLSYVIFNFFVIFIISMIEIDYSRSNLLHFNLSMSFNFIFTLELMFVTFISDGMVFPITGLVVSTSIV